MSLNINYIIFSLLGLFIIILLFLFISIFRKIRSASTDKFNVIQFPIETNKKIKDFINEVSDYLNKLGKLVSHEQKQAVTEINERLKIFESFANEKIRSCSCIRKDMNILSKKILLMGS